MNAIDVTTIALAAVKLKAAVKAKKAAKQALTMAYFQWKELNGIQRVERGTEDWDRMMADTLQHYKAAQKAKDAERRALAKLMQGCPDLNEEEVTV